MWLEVTYTVLATALLIAWARTNTPLQPINLWRLYLPELAAVGVLMTVDAPWQMYWVVFGFTVIMALAQMCSSIMVTEPVDGFYVGVTLLLLTMTYWLTAVTAHDNSNRIAPLVIIVLGIICTYIPLGRRWYLRLMNLLAEHDRTLYRDE